MHSPYRTHKPTGCCVLVIDGFMLCLYEQHDSLSFPMWGLYGLKHTQFPHRQRLPASAAMERHFITLL